MLNLHQDKKSRRAPGRDGNVTVGGTGNLLIAR